MQFCGLGGSFASEKGGLRLECSKVRLYLLEVNLTGY